MASVRTEPVFAHKDGTENTAHYVSNLFNYFLNLQCQLLPKASFVIYSRELTNKLSLLSAGCENGCSRHGQCTLEDGEYHCNCIEGWAGFDCSVPLEMVCDDGLDNDEGDDEKSFDVKR